MTQNLNPRVVELLRWHGHAGGGVHVPFQTRSNPLNQVIETDLVRRLRSLSAEIASNPASSPRWIFLVGGPGNGKSETVQDFLVNLDSQLGLSGALVSVLTQRFSTSVGVLPRKVEIVPTDLGASGPNFAGKIGRLIIVQDATATEVALGNAAQELANDIAELLTGSDMPPVPVFVVCANRGLLARAMNEAVRSFGDSNPITQLLAHVIQASSLGRETLAGRKSCWPLESDPRFACWPLDVESLLLSQSGVPSFEQILNRAVDSSIWEVKGRCLDCVSRDMCPFRQNAEWLRDDTTRANLLTLLRRGELAQGQRWNFRDAFSLIAELLVGQWDDFQGHLHPCHWVHQKVVASDVRSVAALAMELYPHALFKSGPVKETAWMFEQHAEIDPQVQPYTHDLLAALAVVGEGESKKPIRQVLARDYLRLDPATETPPEPGRPLRYIEDEFCQSVEQGRFAARQPPGLSLIEDRLLDVFEKAEREWDLLGRESSAAGAAMCVLRKLAGMITKRSIGTRLAHHALDGLLSDYDACLRDRKLLLAIRNSLQPLLGEAGFSFNLVEILGQPTAESQPMVGLQGYAPGLQVVPAPEPTPSAPGHDIPCIEITGLDYRIPLTFEFYLALRLRKNGCAGSSLPASVRAALDRVRHKYAGQLCRNEDRFVDGGATVSLGVAYKIEIAARGATPSLAEA